MATTSITIALSTGNRVAITDAAGTKYYAVSTLVGIRPDEVGTRDDVVLEFFNGGDKLRILRLDNSNITSPVGATAQLTCDAIDALFPV